MRETLHVFECRDVPHLCEEMKDGVGAVLLTEESLDARGKRCLLEEIDGQPPWSDVPILVFPTSERSAVSLITALGRQANITVFERPLRTVVLISAIHSALRARQRQYQMRDLLHQLEEADRQKDIFLATLSHELRTPLTAIVGWIHLLKRGELSPESLSRAVESMERNTAAQIRLVEDILSVSKLVAGKLEIEKHPVRFDELVAESVETVRSAATIKRIRMHLNLESRDAVLGDTVRLQEVVWNLLSNAIKFTPPDSDIRVHVFRDSSGVHLTVHDTGTGIDADLIPHIFEHFRQADGSNRRSAGGLGLGLAIAKKLVELHGGTIRADSPGRNQGTTMSVVLPALDEAAHPAEFTAVAGDTTKAAADSLRGRVVLLVEDDDDSRELIAYVLRSSGATVFEAESARRAFELFQTSNPHLIVSDIGLAGENGYELIERIRIEENKRGTATPAVALTGFADLKTQQLALSAGYQLHMTKPIEPEVFVGVLAAVLGQNAKRAS